METFFFMNFLVFILLTEGKFSYDDRFPYFFFKGAKYVLYLKEDLSLGDTCYL